jgi:Protein of unknown function (DUF2442)
MRISAVEQPVLITKVDVDDDWLHVDLSDGRRLSTPLDWYPRLRNATPAARRNFRLIGRGEGVHWPETDEDLSLDGMLAGRKAVPA